MNVMIKAISPSQAKKNRMTENAATAINNDLNTIITERDTTMDSVDVDLPVHNSLNFQMVG